MPTTKRFIVDVNIDFHKEFKKTCAANNTSISAVLKNCATRYITEHKKIVVY